MRLKKSKPISYEKPDCDTPDDHSTFRHRSADWKRKNINKSTIDEAEAKRILKADNDLKISEAKLEKEYYDKFLGILPAQKVIALVKAEMDFNREILNRLRRQRNGEGERPGQR